MKITKEELRQIIKEEIQEAFRMEKDFKKGMPVTWSTLNKVVKTTASGRKKVDYERVSNNGVIVGLNVAPAGHNEPGTAMVKVDGERLPVEVDLTELTSA
jgi:hypothetical protein